MPHVLRKISKSKWYQLPWMLSGEVQADSFKDLKTDSNELSVWYVDDNRSNLDQIITCLASNLDSISHIDYALIDISTIQDFGITVAENVPAKTAFTAGNVWHRDLIELTGEEIRRLAREIQNRTQLRQRCEKGRTRVLLGSAFNAKELDLSLLSQDLQQEITSSLM